MPFSDKQKELLANLHHRWTLCSGATRAGKSYLQLFLIPKKIRELRGRDGLVVLLGNTKSTLQRNLIEPMKTLWGNELVGDINSQNKVFLFGEWCYALGCDKITAVDRLRGSSFKLAFGDEVVSWNEETFEMLKSRLDKSYSQFFGTCNPDNPQNFVKANFIDVAEEKGIDLFYQQYTLFDNPFLSQEFIDALCAEYRGTIYYDRYVLGEWKRASGLCYPEYANNTHEYRISKEDLPIKFSSVCGGIDYGKSKSDSAYVVCGIHNKNLYVLKAESVDAEGKTFEQQKRDFENFMLAFLNDYPQFKCAMCFADSAEPVYNNSLRKSFPDYGIRPSIKRPILDRIRALNILMSARRFFVVDELCKPLVQGLQDAVWDDTQADDVRLDDGTSNIDILDALEYAFEYYIPQLVRLEA